MSLIAWSVTPPTPNVGSIYKFDNPLEPQILIPSRPEENSSSTKRVNIIYSSVILWHAPLVTLRRCLMVPCQYYWAFDPSFSYSPAFRGISGADMINFSCRRQLIRLNPSLSDRHNRGDMFACDAIDKLRQAGLLN